MTSRERLLSLLRREVPDTVPIFIRGVSPFGDKMNWMGRFDESYERLRRLVFDETDIFHAVGFDSGFFLSGADIPIEQAVIREDEDWRDTQTTVRTPEGPILSVTRRSRHNLYEVMEVKFYVESEADLERFLSLPYKPAQPQVKGPLAQRQAEIGERGLVVAGIPSALMYFHELLGSEGLGLWSVLHRERIEALVDMLAARVLDYVEYLLEEGAGPVLSYGGPELAVPPLMSPADFHRFVTIPDKPIHDLVHSYGRHTWVHCHGKIGTVLEDFLEMGVDVLEPVEAPPGGDVELADVKRRVGEGIILMGNMPYEAIISWPPERIEAKVKADCEAAMAGGGYIMMPAASPFESVLSDEGFEGYRTYIAAGRKYGRYR